MSLTAQKQGIQDGRQEAQVVKLFDSLKWFDDFLPEEDTFVKNSSIKFLCVYKDKANCVKKKFSQLLDQVEDESIDSGPMMGTIKTTLAELKQMAFLST
eukprot:12128708-Ditylum_brightwellii.AAC.1